MTYEFDLPDRTPTHTVRLRVASQDLLGDLAVPDGAHALVLMPHASGTGRRDARNRRVARTLHEAGLATMLLDLLGPDEQREDALRATHRFDVDALTERLVGALDALVAVPAAEDLAMGALGASTAGAAVLRAAVKRPSFVRAVVTRSGRPDLAGDAVERLEVPTMFIVGAWDKAVEDVNREAFERLRCPKHLEVVEGATPMFDVPGQLEKVTATAAAWFHEHLDALAPTARGGGEA